VAPSEAAAAPEAAPASPYATSPMANRGAARAQRASRQRCCRARERVRVCVAARARRRLFSHPETAGAKWRTKRSSAAAGEAERHTQLDSSRKAAERGLQPPGAATRAASLSLFCLFAPGSAPLARRRSARQPATSIAAAQPFSPRSRHRVAEQRSGRGGAPLHLRDTRAGAALPAAGDDADRPRRLDRSTAMSFLSLQRLGTGRGPARRAALSHSRVPQQPRPPSTPSGGEAKAHGRRRGAACVVPHRPARRAAAADRSPRDGAGRRPPRPARRARRR
jgi:hypothetical protein